jgi:large subunit ribosomal protein L11
VVAAGPKEIQVVVKLAMNAGQATPAPPVGTALGPHGINIGMFVKQYNDATRSQQGTVVPVELTIFKDKSFSFILKTQPTSVLLKKAANVAKGSGLTGKESVGTVTREQVREIAKVKLPDLRVNSLEAAMRCVEGSARAAGIKVEG